MDEYEWFQRMYAYETELDIDVVLYFMIINKIEKEQQARRKCHPIFANRKKEGVYHNLISRHLFKDNNLKFKEYFRLTPFLFDKVLKAIEKDIRLARYNRHKNPITSKEKLCITLRYLATGEFFRSLAFAFRIHNSWISKIVAVTLQAIVKRLLLQEIPPPSMVKLLLNAEEFFLRWNYPLCCGAIDGKHIRIKCPSNSGSLYYNYKDFFSVVLLAIVDANYKFTAIDVGSYGREGDAGIFLKSALGKAINTDKFNMPPSGKIPSTNIVLPHVIVGDEAFALSNNMMKSYPRQHALVDRTKAKYNLRHSRARRTFGIMCAYFRVFFTPIAVRPERIDNIIVASCILHNMMRDSKISAPQQSNFNDTDLPLPENNLTPLGQTTHGRRNNRASEIRDTFKEYFNGIGALPWQESRINRPMSNVV